MHFTNRQFQSVNNTFENDKLLARLHVKEIFLSWIKSQMDMYKIIISQLLIIEAASIVQVIRVNKKAFTLFMYASNRTSQDPEDHTKQNKVFSHQ